ncbi:rho guanine nucleotide exchange factor 2 isoform X1 [Ranitomeya variabilis]|uniref:rho guanine nucleotide exchange factor 2 isoform X1 n=1 Tax=Ranitomeya variabilis TaxID=490064 RepID=UPI0040571024
MNDPEVFGAGPCMVRGHKQHCTSALEPRVPGDLDLQELQEEQDGFLGVPMRRYGPMRCSAHVRDSFRRHSWEPGKRLQEEEAQYDSLSFKGLDPEEMEENLDYNRDPRRTPIIRSTDELESLLSIRGEDAEVTQEEHAKRLQEYLAHVYRYSPLSKSVSMTGIDDVVLYSHGNHLGNGLSAVSCGEFDVLETDEKENTNKEESRFERTLSFIRKISGGKSKNKEKEKMKEREKDSKDKDTRYTNGHLFTTITVSGTNICFVCSKSITAKEALICPTCNVTIHNRCKDALPSCTKVKQKQQKAAFLKNSSALQNVSLRNKSSTLRERPNSAIYPSDSLRHSLLGSRRGRPSLSLSKSVSTTNIAGNLNDESPLGIRRILSQSTDSLNMRNRTLSVESLIDEGGADIICSQLMSDFAMDEKEFEADSWSTAVDCNYLQKHKKDVMKRQDVIYELIQTELHHVRTLKIMTYLFRKGMLEDLQMDPALVQKMFPCVDELSDIHIRFLIQLLERRKDSLEPGSTKNFVINKLGDILINQFSGTNTEHMKKAYTEFCSQHQKAVKLYKELFSRDKKFQQLMRKLTRSQLLRRHGVPECILLVTQRITKYPVLIDRILQNSKGDEEEYQDLATSLTRVKELISSIDQEVYNSEKNLRLQEIYQKVDSKSTAVIEENSFNKEELLRRKLVHEGSLLWKTVAGRFKDVIMLLMTDVLVLLQEKDQKYCFPTLDKSPIISLQNLIVRDIANQEKGMFLISAKPPEMYEVHAASREDRNTWMKLIAQSVKACPKREDFPLIETEVGAKLRKLKELIQQRDREVADILEDKVTLFAKVLQLQAGEDTPLGGNTRKLFRTESTDSYRGEKLISEAIKEVEALKDVILLIGTEQYSPKVDQNHVSTSDTAYTESSSVNGSLDSNKDEDINLKDRNGNQLQNKSPQEEALLRISSLYNLLHGLQGVVAQQDSLLSLQIPDSSDKKESLSRTNSRDLTVSEPLSKSIDKPGTELTLLQRQHTLLQEEMRRSRRQCEERAQESGTLETRLRESEQIRNKLEKELEDAKKQVAQMQREGSSSGIEIGRICRVIDPRRRSLPAGDALYQTFTPPQSNHDRRSTAVDGPLPIITFQDDPDLKDDLSDLTELERLPETADTESSEEEGGGPPTSPSSTREFLRMQDIPEEAESIHDLRDAEVDSSES